MDASLSKPGGQRGTLLALTVLAAGMGLGWWELDSRGGRNSNSAEWPPITDPAALRREAAALCRGEGGWRELQPAQYPPAMSALHPASISVSGGRVYLALAPGAYSKHRYHGYYVWPERVDRPDSGISREESDGEQNAISSPTQ